MVWLYVPKQQKTRPEKPDGFLSEPRTPFRAAPKRERHSHARTVYHVRAGKVKPAGQKKPAAGQDRAHPTQGAPEGSLYALRTMGERRRDEAGNRKPSGTASRFPGAPSGGGGDGRGAGEKPTKKNAPTRNV